jgi:hypothetical protein
VVEEGAEDPGLEWWPVGVVEIGEEGPTTAGTSDCIVLRWFSSLSYDSFCRWRTDSLPEIVLSVSARRRCVVTTARERT